MRVGPLGAVLVGGGSRRFGKDKAGAGIGGVPLAERAARTLESAVERVVLVGADVELAERLARPLCADRRPGRGPLAGVEAALLEARALGRPGALVLACDMPLVPPRLFAELLEEMDGADAVLPESPGPVGVEPLCGFYALTALPVVQDRLGCGEPSMRALLERLEVRRLPVERFAGPDAPEVVFLNVNTPADRDRAEALLAERGG